MHASVECKRLYASVKLKPKVRHDFKQKNFNTSLEIEKFHAFRATQHFNLNNAVQFSSSDTKPPMEREEKSDKKQQR